MQQAAVGHPLDCHPKIKIEIFLNKKKRNFLNTEYFFNKKVT